MPSNDAEQISEDLKQTKLLEGKMIYGMTTKEAAYFAGYAYDQAKRLLKTEPLVEQAKALQKQMQHKYGITRERVVEGMVDAMERAKVYGDVKTELNAWKELGKMHGHYAPSEHKIHISKDAARLERELQELPTSEVLKIASSSGNWQNEAIDAEFEEIKHD